MRARSSHKLKIKSTRTGPKVLKGNRRVEGIFLSFLPLRAMSVQKPPKRNREFASLPSTDRLATCKKNVRTHPRKTVRRAIDRWKKRRGNIHTRATRRDEVSDPPISNHHRAGRDVLIRHLLSFSSWAVLSNDCVLPAWNVACARSPIGRRPPRHHPSTARARHKPVGLMPISQHHRDVGRHPNESSLVLSPLKYRLQVLLFTLCLTEMRHDLGTIVPPHDGSDHLLNQNGVKGFANVHVDDGRRKLFQLELNRLRVVIANSGAPPRTAPVCDMPADIGSQSTATARVTLA